MLCIFACCVLVVVECAGARNAQLRVYKGTEALPDEFQFAVSLDYKLKIKFCTGSLLSDSWVITAGHCLGPVITNLTTVRYANFTVRPNETKAYVTSFKFYIHPRFSVHKLLVYNDLGLILTEKIPFQQFVKLSAVDYKALLGLPIRYAGFGRTTKKFRNPLEELKEVTFEPLQVGEGVVTLCPRELNPGYLPSICVAPKCSENKQMPYYGDSGGPLMCHGKLIGVVSGTFKHLDPITKFTPVSPNLEWIHDVMSSKPSRR